MSRHPGWRASKLFARGVAARTGAGQAWLVDVRVKTFASEVASRLGFLCEEFCLSSHEAVPDQADVYPLLRCVRFERADLALEISLVRRTQLGRNTAHTGYQIRRALDLQAQAVRKALGEHTPSRLG